MDPADDACADPELVQPVPHWGLAASHLAHGLSWPALAVLAYRGYADVTFPGLAWVHLVTLGWLSLVSLTMLVHVLEELFALRWPGGLLVRKTLGPYVFGVVLLLAGFLLPDTRVLAAGAVVIAAAIAAWLVFAAGAFASFVPAPGRSVRALRAFQLVLALLAGTAALGLGMAWTLGFGGPAWWLARAPALHAHLGGFGWLTLLTIGVAQRTMRELFGRGSPRILFHVGALTALVLALVPLSVGLATGVTGWSGLALAFAAIGVVSHAVDTALLWRGATSRHRPPQAFVLASTGWLAVAVVLAGGVLAGRDVGPAYLFAALIGWLGQMVVGHLHHVPVVAFGRLAGVPIRSPADWLDGRLSWTSFAGFQAAVALVLLGSALGTAPIVAGSILGFVAWITMTANVVGAWPRVRDGRPRAADRPMAEARA